MAKNFTAVLQKDKSFDGMEISQTYEEYEDSKKKPAVREDEAKRRVSLYLPESLYEKVSMLASVSRTNMNQLIINLLEEHITGEKIRNALQVLQEDVRKSC